MNEMKGNGDKCSSCLHEQCDSWRCPYNNEEDIPGSEIHRGMYEKEAEEVLEKWRLTKNKAEAFEGKEDKILANVLYKQLIDALTS